MDVSHPRVAVQMPVAGSTGGVHFGDLPQSRNLLSQHSSAAKGDSYLRRRLRDLSLSWS